MHIHHRVVLSYALHHSWVSHFNNLLEVQGNVPAVQENSSTGAACKAVVSQDALLTTSISALGELTPQAVSMPAHLPSLTNME